MATFGRSETSRRATAAVVIGVLLAIAGFSCLIAGIHLVNTYKSSAKKNMENQCKSAPDICSYSAQAKTSGLAEFLKKVINTYYNVKPFMITESNGFSLEQVQAKFKVYDPSPTNLKNVNDKAMQLLDELKKLKIDVQELQPREKKALSQVKHFLQHVFGSPYDAFYYGGTYLLGPNLFCWQEICRVGGQVETVGRAFKPKSVSDLERFRDKVKTFNETFTQYKENLKYGVKAGMVGSIEQCDAGYTSFTRRYPQIANKGSEGKPI